jgi:hypothetical protein
LMEPTMTILKAIKDNWSLTGDLATASVNFSTGWYDKSKDTPQVTVTETSAKDQPLAMGYAKIRVTSTFAADVWVTSQKGTAKGIGKAKDYKWAMRKEVRRILKPNVVGLYGIKYVILNGVGRSLDEESATPPILRWRQEFTVIWDES